MSRINLRPTLKIFPFDETCSELISVLESKDFDIPELEIKFHDYGGQYMMYQNVF